MRLAPVLSKLSITTHRNFFRYGTISRKIFAQTVFFCVSFIVAWRRKIGKYFWLRGQKKLHSVSITFKSDDHEPHPQIIPEKYRAGDLCCQLFARKAMGR